MDTEESRRSSEFLLRAKAIYCREKFGDYHEDGEEKAKVGGDRSGGAQSRGLRPGLLAAP